MEPKARHVLIGIFTLVTSILAVVFALWLANVNTQKGVNHYYVEFSESVSGLSRGSAVQYTGMTVGEVVELRLHPENPSKVRAEITVDEDVPIRHGVTARLQMVGITGQAVISLTGGNIDAPLLIADTGALPVLYATPSPLATLLDNGENLMSNLTKIAINLSDAFSEENVAHFGNILQHIDTFTGSFASESEMVKELFGGAKQVMGEFNTAIGKYASLAENVNVVITKEGARAFDSAAQAMQSLANSSQQLQRMLRNNEGSFNSGMQGMQEIGPTLMELKNSFSTLQSILKNLEQNPAAYFFDGDKLKEFRP